jgi:hypothetical protein
MRNPQTFWNIGVTAVAFHTILFYQSIGKRLKTLLKDWDSIARYGSPSGSQGRHQWVK